MKINIGIIREEKVPQDRRVPLTPSQCAKIKALYPSIDIVVQPSSIRCYSDAEYLQQGIRLCDDLADRHILLGVKEVPVANLLSDKTYFFFSHTIKEQSYNRALLQEILKKDIRLIDYEVLTNEDGQRVIAFGRFAGMVGAHNALWAYGQRMKSFQFSRLHNLNSYEEILPIYRSMIWPSLRIVLTGTGRVANGAAEVLNDMGIRKVSPSAYVKDSFSEAVFTQLACKDYVARKADGAFEKHEFYAHPKQYKSIFSPYTACSDIMINGIYWDPDAPAFFSKEDMNKEHFSISTIADITCDIAPEASIPSTIRPSTIQDPIYGYDPLTGKEVDFDMGRAITVMAIDNLPNELPRDASESFGQQWLDHILPELLKDESPMLERATIARNGQLGREFQYLTNFVNQYTS